MTRAVLRHAVAPIIAIMLAAIPLVSAQAANPPRIEYVLVLNAHGKPRTFFHPGAKLAVRVELYFVGRSAARVKTIWHVTSGRRSMFHRALSGGFHGPTRGHLFTQTLHLSHGASQGTYDATVVITVNGHRLSRTARFYVRR